MLGVMCLVALLQLVCLFLLVLSVLVFSAYRLRVLMQKIPEQTTPTETSIPTPTKRLKASHQAFTSIFYNLH